MMKKAFKAAFPYTLPICVGFLFLGLSYGFMMRSKGFSFVYPLCMSFFIYAGSMEFVTANLLLSAFNPVYAFFLTLMVNAREVSLTREITSFVTGGSTRFSICGKMMRKKVWFLLYPRTDAASYCPLGMDSIPER